MALSKLLIVGLDDHHAPQLRRIGRDRGVEVVPLLDVSEVRRARSYDLDALLRRAEQRFAAAGEVAGITAYWDMPASSVAACLAERHGLPTPGLRAVTAMEHKYWSRRIQQVAVPEVTPAFELVDLRRPAAAERIGLPYPFWLKPIRSAAGHLAMQIDDRRELDLALRWLREGTVVYGRPFQRVLDSLDLPPEIAEVPATAAIAEELLEGDQVTLEGYALDGAISCYGVFDIHREANGCTFARYLYPSQLAASARERMTAAATTLMSALEWDRGAFNIEFFHEPSSGRIQLLEVNPRISQEHAHLTHWVDSASNLEVMVDLALGRPPPAIVGSHAGPHAVAAKVFLRAYRDAVVADAPDPAVVAELERRHAPCRIVLVAEQGVRLAELRGQEPYSYELAHVYLAGEDEHELEQRYQRIVDELGMRLLRVGVPPGSRAIQVDGSRLARLDPLP